MLKEGMIMANIMDYIEWRGDIEIQEDGFNEIDNLILARLSYFPFDGLIREGEEITVKEAYHRFQNTNVGNARILQKEDLDLFPAMASSRRYGELILKNYINKISIEEEKQFSAITILLPDNTIYIGYRGTDNTLVGWKEDLNMSFQDNVPAQRDAIKYLEKYGKEEKKEIRVGGHSKGGNLAIYASAFCEKEVQDRIKRVYNNDGPGVSDKVTQMENYKRILPKIATYVPQSSIIGRLLNHEEEHIVVKSIQTGIMQHDLYSWQLLGSHFIYVDELTNGSEFIDRTIKDWLEEVSPEERGKVIDIIFEIIYTTDAKTLSQLGAKWFANARIILKSYKNVDEKSREMISQTLYCLFKIAKTNLLHPKEEKQELHLAK